MADKKGNHMAKTALVAIADGIEEIEAVTIIDVLRRAGVEVTVASVGAQQISGAHGVVVTADCTIDSCMDVSWDLIALPGGIPGAEHLAASQPLEALLRAQVAKGSLYGGNLCCASAGTRG